MFGVIFAILSLPLSSWCVFIYKNFQNIFNILIQACLRTLRSLLAIVISWFKLFHIFPSFKKSCLDNPGSCYCSELYCSRTKFCIIKQVWKSNRTEFFFFSELSQLSVRNQMPERWSKNLLSVYKRIYDKEWIMLSVSTFPEK